MEQKITIRGKEYVMRHSLRAKMIWETIYQYKRMWQLTTFTDQWNYMWAMISAGSGANAIPYDEFLEAIEENPALIHEYEEFVVKALQAEKKFQQPKNGDGDGKN